MSQISFQFKSEKTNFYYEEEFLLLPENIAAMNFLKNFFAQENFSQSRFSSMILKAEKASGKTHLLHIFAKKFDAEFLNKEKIADVNPASFFVANKFYILEDINEINDEELVLRVVNSAFEANAFLILTSLPQVEFRLKDLNSRLRNIFAVEIKNPSLESVKQLLAKGFSRSQIKLSTRVIDFVAENIERTCASIFDVVKLIELHCQENGKNIAIKEIREILKK